jgi:hypothetical protein
MSDWFDSDWLNAVRRWFRSLTQSENRSGDSARHKSDRYKSGWDKSDKEQRRAAQRASRFAALSPETRWAAEAEAEYTAPQSAEHPGGRTVVAPHPTPPFEPSAAQPLESPVPNGAAPFAAAAPGLVDDAPAEVSDTPAAAEQQRPEQQDDEQPWEEQSWEELWEADGLVSHDGTWLRFQSWDGRHDIQVLMGDMRASAKGDNLRLYGESFRVDIEDVEPLRPPFAGRDDLATTARPSKSDPFGGLLDEFPHLGGDAG